MPSVLDLTGKLSLDTSQFDSGISAAKSSVDSLTSTNQAATGSTDALGVGLAAAGAAGVAGFGSIMSAAGGFESNLNNIQALTGATESELSGLGDKALQIGQDTAFSANEGAQAIAELGKSGIPIPDIMGGAADAVASLAAAGEVDIARAAEVMGGAMNTFGISGDKAIDVADTLAAGANKSAASVNDLAMGMSQAGAGAAALGIPLEDTVGALAAFADRGLQGSDAGTSLKTMLASLTPNTDKAREAFTELGLSTDEVANRFFDAQGNFVGLEQASTILYDSLKGLTQEERAVALETLFGSDASRAAAIMFDTQADSVAGTGDSIAGYIDAMQPMGQAQDVAAAKMKGMNGALESLDGSMDTLRTTMGTGLTPVIEMVARGVASFVNVLSSAPAPVQTLVTALLGLTAGTAALAGGALLVVPRLMEMKKGLDIVRASSIAMNAAMKLSSVSLGPVGIAIAAIGLAIVAYQNNWLGFRDIVNEVASRVFPALAAAARMAGDVLQEVFRVLGTVPSQIGQGLGQAVDYITGKIQGLQGVLAGLSWEGVFAGLQGAADWILGQFQSAADAIGGLFQSLNIPIPPGLQAIGDWLQRELGDRIKAAADAVRSWWDDVSDIGVPSGLQSVGDWFGSKFGGHVDAAIGKIHDFQSALAAAGQGFGGEDPTIGLGYDPEGGDPFAIYMKERAEASKAAEIAVQSFGLELDNVTNLTGAAITATDEAARASYGWGSAMDTAGAQVAEAHIEISEAMGKVIAAYRDQMIPANESFMGSLSQLVPVGEGVIDLLGELEQAGQIDTSGLATFLDGMTDARSALEGLMTTIGQIQDLGAPIAAAEQFVTALVGVRGEVSELDTLLQRNVISWDEYTAAQVAQESIARDNTVTQQLLNGMLVEQLPALAAASDQYADYVAQLAIATPAEQAHALAMLDSANQAKVAASFSTAYAGALGEIPPNVATEIIANAAQADPVLKGLLADFDLIEVGADGTITVNMDAVSQQTIDQFKLMFADADVHEADGLIHVTTDSGTELVYDQFNNLIEKNGTTISASVDVQFKGMQAGINSGVGFGATWSTVGTDIASGIEESVKQADFSGVGSAVQTNVDTALTEISITDASQVADDIMAAIGTGITDAGTEQITTPLQGVIQDAIDQGITTAETANEVGAKMVMSAGDQITTDGSALTDKLNAVTTDAVDAAISTAETANQVGAKLVMSAGDQITSDGGAITDKLNAVTTDAVTAATTTAQTATAVGTALVTSAADQVTADGASISTNFVTATRDAVTNAQNEAQTATLVGTALVTNASDEIVSTGGGISTQLVTATHDAVTNAQTEAATATVIGTDLMTSIGEGVTSGGAGLTSELQNAVLGAIQGVSELSGAAHDAGLPIGTAIGTGIADGVAAALPAIRGQIEAGLAGMSVNVPVNVNVTTNVQQSIVGAVETAAPAVYDAAYEVGTEVPAGLTGGMNAGADDVIGAATTLAVDSTDATRTTFGIGSPSKVYFEIGQQVTQGLSLGVIDGIPGVINAMGEMVRPFNEVEADLMALAQTWGPSFVKNLTETLLDGNSLMIDTAGQMVNQFGDALQEDFTILTGDKSGYPYFGEKISAMIADGMTDAAPLVVEAATTVSDAAMVPIEDMGTRAYDATTDAVVQVADTMTDMTPLVTGAAAVLADTTVLEFQAMHDAIVALVNDMLVQAGIAAQTAASVSDSASSMASSTDTSGKTKIDASGGKSSGKNASASGGSVKTGNVDKNADLSVSASGGTAVDKSGKGKDGKGKGGGHTTHIDTVVVQDGRDLDRWMRDKDRERNLNRSRG